MKRISFFLIIILMVVPMPALAQDGTNENPALRALMWGVDYFPYPEWQVVITTTPGQVTGSWTTEAAYDAVVFYVEQFPYEAYSGEQLSGLANDQWMSDLMVNYTTWTELSRCVSGDYLVIELKATYDGGSYTTRYWLWWEEGILKSVFATFPRDGLEALQAVGNQYFPTVAACQ
jgi:hypothetical protein